MARRFGRLWTIMTAIALFLIIIASVQTLRPLRRASDIVVEPESQDIVNQDQKQPEQVPEGGQDAESQEDDAAELEWAQEEVARMGETPTNTKPEINEGDTQTTLTTSTTPTPTKTELSKIIVMGKLSTEDTDWVGQDVPEWQNAIYVVDLPPEEESPTGLRTKMNKAREAMAYLTYIVDNYPNFPDVMTFIHPHRRGMPQAWHTDARGNDAVNMLRDLKLETVMERGYVNLRCNNEVGCPDEVQPFRDPPNPEKHAEHAFSVLLRPLLQRDHGQHGGESTRDRHTLLRAIRGHPKGNPEETEARVCTISIVLGRNALRRCYVWEGNGIYVAYHFWPRRRAL